MRARFAGLLALTLMAGCANAQEAPENTSPESTTPESAGPETSATADNTTATPIDVTGDIPTDIRRTTVFVRDMEAALALWQGVLGLQINYDAEMNVSGPAFTQNGPPRPIRLVLLNGDDPWIGWIGLIQYTDAPTEPETPLPEYLGPGSHVFVLNVDDADKRCAMAEALPGIRMMAPVKVATYPGRNGGPPISVKGCQFFDADGAYLELNQTLP